MNAINTAKNAVRSEWSVERSVVTNRAQLECLLMNTVRNLANTRSNCEALIEWVTDPNADERLAPTP